MPMVSFYTPWKHQKTISFLTFPGLLERDQWHETSHITFNLPSTFLGYGDGIPFLQEKVMQ